MPELPPLPGPDADPHEVLTVVARRAELLGYPKPFWDQEVDSGADQESLDARDDHL